jgi:isoquinoline 1-oxidoreductase alpha subunit
MMLRAVDVLTGNPDLSERELASAMDDMACRCGSHPRIIPAMRQAAQKMK